MRNLEFQRMVKAISKLFYKINIIIIMIIFIFYFYFNFIIQSNYNDVNLKILDSAWDISSYIIIFVLLSFFFNLIFARIILKPMKNILLSLICIIIIWIIGNTFSIH